MTTTLLKKKLTEAISKIEDEQFLEALHTIITSRQEEELYELSAAQQKELDRRLASYKAGKTKTYSWEEVKANLLKRKK
ncbi:MAG: addiction module protein [Sphingobacteriales bacterium]|nr:addiction module protein [Sphingobacteriales bacterium]MBI3718423.1 addiction module protein [Sphingobacteriales bacterium]